MATCNVAMVFVSSSPTYSWDPCNRHVMLLANNFYNFVIDVIFTTLIIHVYTTYALCIQKNTCNS